MNMFDDVRKFYEKFNQAYGGPPRTELETGEDSFRIRFKKEELEEYIIATDFAYDDSGSAIENDADRLDALVDLVFVAVGTAYKHGWDFNEAWKRVVAANMAKEASSEGSGERGKWKIVKPAGWLPPNHLDLVNPER